MSAQTSLFAPDAPGGVEAATRPVRGERQTRCWIGVVSAEHVRRGVSGGFAQLCHGKAAPLGRMRAGDWLAYYSPAEKRGGGEPVQAFTAIGRVKDGAAYERDMGGGFVPFRRDVAYLPCRTAPIRPLLAELSFLPDGAHWGYVFRRGHLQVPPADFLLIARAMGVDPASLELAGEGPAGSAEPANG